MTKVEGMDVPCPEAREAVDVRLHRGRLFCEVRGRELRGEGPGGESG